MTQLQSSIPRPFSRSSGRPVTLAEVTSGAPLQAVVYDDDAACRRAIFVIVERSGVEVVEISGRVSDVVERVRGLHPDLIVLELALSATLGLGIIPALLAAAPGAAVVLLSPFNGLRAAAVEAGAYALVDDTDLRELGRCVRRLVEERDRTRAADSMGEPPGRGRPGEEGGADAEA